MGKFGCVKSALKVSHDASEFLGSKTHAVFSPHAESKLCEELSL